MTHYNLRKEPAPILNLYTRRAKPIADPGNHEPHPYCAQTLNVVKFLALSVLTKVVQRL